MVNEIKYFNSIQKEIGDTYSADQIFDDPWREVIEELNQLSIDYCRDIRNASLNIITFYQGWNEESLYQNVYS